MPRLSQIFLICLCMLIDLPTRLTLFAAPTRPPVPTLESVLTSQPPVIDGQLDDNAWQNAEPVTTFWNLEGTAKHQDLVWAKVISNDDGLFICYRMQADAQSGIPSGSETRDEGVWFSPNIQIFIQPPGTSSYYVFTLNSLNTQEDAKDYDSLWNATWDSATFIAPDKSYWQAEVALPFAAFDLADSAGTDWRINLTCVSSVGGQGYILTWAPTFANFHSPSYFGKLSLGNIPWDRRRCGLSLAAGPGAPGHMDIVAEYFNPIETDATLHVTITRPDGSKTSKHQHVLLTPTTSTERFSFATDHAGQHQFLATLSADRTSDSRSQENQLILASRHIHTVTPPPLDVWLDRSIYTNQKRARVKIEGWQSGLAGTACTISLSSDTTTKIATQQPFTIRLDKNARATFTLNLTALPEGRHTLKVQPTSESNTATALSIPFDKLPPQAGTVWSDDRGVLYKDENPFFPIGFYYVQNFLKDGLLEEYVDSGLNTIVWEWSNSQGYKNALEQMNAQGLNLILSVQNEAYARHLQDRMWQAKDTERTTIQKDYEKHVAKFVRDVASTNPTNLIAWYVQDEPNLDILPFVKRSSEIVARADPRRPRLVVPCLSTVFRSYADVVEILAPDPYPGFPDGPLVKVSSFLDEARAATRFRRPTLAVLQAFGEPAGDTGVVPTPAELRCMTFLSIAHEARGIIYFSYSYNGPMREKHPELWKAVKTSAAQLRDLGAATLSASAGQFALSQSTGSQQVHTRIIKHNGQLLLIAVNTQRSVITDVQWKMPDVPDGSFQVLWEDREINTQVGTFADDFAPLEVHVYRRKLK